MSSLRKAINDKCKSCVYDNLAAGTWRQQVTLCPVTDCALWPHRAQTKAKIPDSVLRYYGIDPTYFQHKATTPNQATTKSSSSSDDGKTASFQGLTDGFEAGQRA